MSINVSQKPVQTKRPVGHAMEMGFALIKYIQSASVTLLLHRIAVRKTSQSRLQYFSISKKSKINKSIQNYFRQSCFGNNTDSGNV